MVLMVKSLVQQHRPGTHSPIPHALCHMSTPGDAMFTSKEADQALHLAPASSASPQGQLPWVQALLLSFSLGGPSAPLRLPAGCCPPAWPSSCTFFPLRDREAGGARQRWTFHSQDPGPLHPPSAVS